MNKIRKEWSDFKRSFYEGMIKPPLQRTWYRWLSAGALWLLAALCLVGGLSILTTAPLPWNLYGIAMVIFAVTFTITSATVITMFHTTEIQRDTERIRLLTAAIIADTERMRRDRGY